MTESMKEKKNTSDSSSIMRSGDLQRQTSKRDFSRFFSIKE